ncbi:MAG TPA: glycosyltransferase [Chitinophagaceae bacterium]|nr:glycosyltransferase [Chitinophagaceae bacterium]
MPSTCAIVILNWNGKKFLEQFLPSVLQTTYQPLQFIVADNASTDDSVAFVKTNYPDIRIIENAQNWGFAKGYNEALKQVEADYYVILNSDVEVSQGWLEPMVELLDRNVTIAAGYYPTMRKTGLNTPARQVGGSTSMDILFAGVGFLMLQKKTLINTTPPCRFAGRVARRFLSVRPYFTSWKVLTNTFSHTRKRSICAGESSRLVIRSMHAPPPSFGMSEVVHYKKIILKKPFSIFATTSSCSRRICRFQKK